MRKPRYHTGTSTNSVVATHTACIFQVALLPTEIGCAAAAVDGLAPAALHSATEPTFSGRPARCGGSPSGGSSSSDACEFPRLSEKATAMTPISSTQLQEAITAGVAECGDTVQENGVHNGVNGTKGRNSSALKLKNARAGIKTVMGLASAVAEAVGAHTSSSSNTLSSGAVESMVCDTDPLAISSTAARVLDAPGSASRPKHVVDSTAKEAVAVAALVTKLLGALDASVAVVLRALDCMPHVQFYEICENTRREARTAQAVLIFARSHDAATASTPGVLQTAMESVLADPLPKAASRNSRGMKQVAADVRGAVAAASSALDPYNQRGKIGFASSVPAPAPAASEAEPARADPVPDGEPATEKLAQSRTEIVKSLELAAKVASMSLFDAPGRASSRLPPVVVDTDRRRRARSVAGHVTQLMGVLDASTTLTLRCLRNNWAPDRTKDALHRTMQDACMAQALLESVKDGAAVDDQSALGAAKAKATAIHVTLDVAQDVEKLPAMIKSATVAAVTALNEYLKTDSRTQVVPELSSRQIVPCGKPWAKRASDSKAAETLNSVATVRRLDLARERIVEGLRLAEAVSRNQTTAFTSGSSEDERKPMEPLVAAAERARDVAALVTQLLEGLDVRIGVAVRSIEEEWAPPRIKEVFQSTRQEACTALALLESVRNGAAVDDRAERRAAETKGAMLAPFPPQAWGTKKLVDRVESVAAAAVAVLTALVKFASPAPRAERAPSAIVRSVPWVKKASNSKAAETLDSTRAENALEKARQSILRSLQLATDVAEERLATASAKASDAYGPGSAECPADEHAGAVASLVTQLLEPVEMWVAEALKSVREEQATLRIKGCFHNTRQKACTAQALLESVRDGAAVDDEEALKAAIAKGTKLAPPPPHAWGTKKLVEKVESAAAVAMVLLKPYAKAASYARLFAYVKAPVLPPSSSALAPNHWLKKASDSQAAETLDSARAEEKLKNARQDILKSFKLAEAVAEMLRATASERKSGDSELEPVEHPTGDLQRARAVATLVMTLLEPLSLWVTESLKSVQEERPPAHIKRVFHSTRQKACTAQALLESVRDGSAVDDEEALEAANTKGRKLAPPPPHAWGLKKLVEKVESVSAAANAALGPYVTTEVKDRAVTEPPRASTSSITNVAPAAASGTVEMEGTDAEQTVYSKLVVKRLEGAREEIMETLRLASAFTGEDISAAAAPDLDVGGGGSANIEQLVGTVERPRAVAALVVELMGGLQKSMSLAIWSVQQQWLPNRMKDVLHKTGQKAYTAQLLLESVGSGAAVGDEEAIAAAKAKGAALAPSPSPSPGSTLWSETLVETAINAAAAAKYAMRTATTIPAGGAATAEAPSEVNAVAPMFATALMATAMPGERLSATHPGADLDTASIPRLTISSPTVSGQAADEESRAGLSQPPPHKKCKTAGKQNTLECATSAGGKQALAAAVKSSTDRNQSAPYSTVARLAFESTVSPSPHN